MTVLLPSFIADANWFLLALGFPVTVLGAMVHFRWCMRTKGISRHTTTQLYVLLGLLLLSSLLAVLGVSLEVYHSHGCPNSAVFHDDTEKVARFVYRLCTRHNVPYWVAFGNLLFVMRGKRGIPVGDTDSDIGVIKTDFVNRFGSMNNFSSVVQNEAVLQLQRPVYVVYHLERELVQIYLDNDLRGSHADIWLYRQEMDKKTGIKWLVNDDRTIRGKRLLYDQVLPLQTEKVFFLNVPVTLPRNASYLATAEYGPTYMTPITMRMECIENMLNGYTFYKTSLLMKLCYAVLFVALTAIVTIVAAYYIPPLRQALRMKIGAEAEESDKYFV